MRFLVFLSLSLFQVFFFSDFVYVSNKDNFRLIVIRAKNGIITTATVAAVDIVQCTDYWLISMSCRLQSCFKVVH